MRVEDDFVKTWRFTRLHPRARSAGVVGAVNDPAAAPLILCSGRGHWFTVHLVTGHHGQGTQLFKIGGNHVPGEPGAQHLVEVMGVHAHGALAQGVVGGRSTVPGSGS